MLGLINKWFMVSVRMPSYGCTREVAKHKRGVKVPLVFPNPLTAHRKAF